MGMNPGSLFKRGPTTESAALEHLTRRLDMFERTQRGMVERLINKELVDLPFRIFEFGTAVQTEGTLKIPNQTRQQTRITSILITLDTLSVGPASLKLDDQTTIPLNPTAVEFTFLFSEIDFIVKGQDRVLTWHPDSSSKATCGLFICGWAIPSQIRELG